MLSTLNDLVGHVQKKLSATVFTNGCSRRYPPCCFHHNCFAIPSHCGGRAKNQCSILIPERLLLTILSIEGGVPIDLPCLWVSAGSKNARHAGPRICCSDVNFFCWQSVLSVVLSSLRAKATKSLLYWSVSKQRAFKMFCGQFPG